MLDLPASLVVLLCINVTIFNSLFIDDFYMDGRMLDEVLIDLKEGHIGRVQSDYVIRRVHHHTELLRHHLPLLQPCITQFIQVLFDFAV